MQQIDTRDLDELTKNLERAMKEFPEERRAAHEKVGKILKRRLDANIASRVNDAHGKIRSWQEVHIGSKGGYAAIRAKATPSGKDGPGAITNYLESGHKLSGNAIRLKKSNNGTGRVRGRYFYQATAREISRDAEQIMEELAQTMAKKIEGN